MSDPASKIVKAREELSRLEKTPISQITSAAAKDLFLAAFLLASARRKCGIADAKERKSTGRGGRPKQA